MSKNNALYWALGIGTAAAGGLMLYLRKRNDNSNLTLDAKLNRQIAACRQDQCQLLAGLQGLAGPYSRIGLSGAVSKFDVPMYAQSFYSSSQRSEISAKLEQIRLQYNAIINRVAWLTNIPEMLIRSFIFIESAGNATAQNGNAFGLMQIDPAGANDMLFLENKNGRITANERALLRAYLGTRFDRICAMPYMGAGVYITAADLRIPELNILLGSIFLGILIDESTEADNVRLDRVVARYNRGYFSKKGISGDKNAVLAAQPSITQQYILKLAGKNGTLDILA